MRETKIQQTKNRIIRKAAFDRNTIMCCVKIVVIWKKKPDGMML